MDKVEEGFQLSDDDWMGIGPFIIHELLFEAGRVNLPIAIDNLIYGYVLSGKPNGEKELKQTFMRVLGYKKDDAEKMAKMTVEEFKRLRNEPIEKIWMEVEKDVNRLNCEKKRMFNFLKSKYAPFR